MKEDFKGVYCVSVTAFKDDESIDEERTKAHLDRVIDAGVHGVIIGGSTGEFASLSEKEREHLLEFGIAHVKGRVPVLVGTMAPSTKETIRWCKFAKDAGADGLMIVNPYYGAITDESLYQHFKTVAKSIDLPIMPYNNNDTSGNDLVPEIAIKLAENCSNIRYVKACVDTRRIQTIINGSKGKIKVFMGVDDLSFQGFLLGATGVVSGGSNIAPKSAVKIYNLIVKDKDIDSARELWYKYVPLATLVEAPKTWISTIKAGCEIMGDPVGNPRKPLMPATKEIKQELRNILENLREI